MLTQHLCVSFSLCGMEDVAVLLKLNINIAFSVANASIPSCRGIEMCVIPCNTRLKQANQYDNNASQFQY